MIVVFSPRFFVEKMHVFGCSHYNSARASKMLIPKTHCKRVKLYVLLSLFVISLKVI